MTILNDIVKNTKAKLVEKKAAVSLDEIKLQLSRLDLPKGKFKASLAGKAEAVIAEIKKASPSAGIISENFDPIQKAQEYEAFGAAALSILTEEDFFLGSNQYLEDVKAITSLPILRKDFMVDEYQIYEAKLIGADCILLIASILSDIEITDFVALADLIEVIIRKKQHFNNALIGVNNRNLKTFEVDINNSVNLKNSFSGDNIFIAESGIKNKDDLSYLKERGISVFLIGESLMRGSF